MLECGGGPFVLCPELLHENVTTGNTGSILCLSSGYKINSFLPYKYFPDFRWWFIDSSQTTYEGRGFGRYLGGQNRKRIFEKTRVGFGRTELSLRLSWTEFCALSSGHGPRGRGFEGFCKTLDFHTFWESKMQKHMKIKDEHGQMLVSRALDPRNMIS